MSARIAFLGDTFLGGAARPYMRRHGDDWQLARIRHLWADADLVVANLEAAVTRQRSRAEKADAGRRRYWYRAEARSLHALARNGITVVSLANNHVGDFGPEGVLDTMFALDAAGIGHCGAGTSDASARRPLVVDVAGLRVGFLAVMQRYEMYVQEALYARSGHAGPARLRTSRLGPDIAALRERVDLCVVLVHWGRNYREVTPLQERLAREIAAAGPDLVVGHHPHVAQRVDVVEGVPVLYSLGNAAFGTRGRFRGAPAHGLVVLADVESRGLVGLDVTLLETDNGASDYQPRPATGPVAEATLRRLYDPAVLDGVTPRRGVPAALTEAQRVRSYA